MMIAKKTTASALVFVLALSLSACQTTTGSMSKSGTDNDRIAGAMASAARDAAGSGYFSESLAINEKLYHDNPNRPETILAYARDLRRAGRIDDAKLVIRTPALGKKADEPLLTEAALVMVAEGNYAEAVGFAEKAIAKNPKSAYAHQALALALSGEGKHANAEDSFATALSIWPEGRDQTAVINNLAMSQAAQGKIKDAKATMAMATGEALRSEVYQNNRSFLSSLDEGQVAMKTNVINFEPVTAADEKVAGAVMVMKPTQKPHSEKPDVVASRAPMPEQAQLRGPQEVGHVEPLPVTAVEKQEISLIKKNEPQKLETISPAAGGTSIRPTPLFDPMPKNSKKPWWKMGFTPNDNTAARSGLNK
ncbi:MAG: hypothetical protein EBQ96_00310 [Proteobacteria bacterium]|nr:hypothetical protein [Pseudomonadota bacterium]